jgi:hypothetical protein
MPLAWSEFSRLARDYLPIFENFVGPWSLPGFNVEAMNQSIHPTYMQPPQYRFSGHETFACRYAWLPKAINGIAEYPDLLLSARQDDAMVELGLGKNMVRSVRFWAESAGIIEASADGHKPTELGINLFLEGYDGKKGEFENGLDPYLEDIQTLWLLHWKLATNRNSLIFSWDFLLNQFQEPELHASSVVSAFSRVLKQISVSSGSLEQLWEVFLHSYVPTRGRKGEVREDNLDCPFTELGLLIHTGFTESSLRSGRVEAKYAFRREEKPEIGKSLFAFCLHDFWKNRYPEEQSIPFHLVVTGHGSPGQVFKIPEADIRTRLLAIEESSNAFVFEESAAIPRIVRKESEELPSLARVYKVDHAHP